MDNYGDALPVSEDIHYCIDLYLWPLLCHHVSQVFAYYQLDALCGEWTASNTFRMISNTPVGSCIKSRCELDTGPGSLTVQTHKVVVAS